MLYVTCCSDRARTVRGIYMHAREHPPPSAMDTTRARKNMVMTRTGLQKKKKTHLFFFFYFSLLEGFPWNPGHWKSYEIHGNFENKQNNGVIHTTTTTTDAHWIPGLCLLLPWPALLFLHLRFWYGRRRTLHGLHFWPNPVVLPR